MSATNLAVQLPSLNEQEERFRKFAPNGRLDTTTYIRAKSNSSGDDGSIILPNIPKHDSGTGNPESLEYLKDPYGKDYHILARRCFEWSCGYAPFDPDWLLLDGRFDNEVVYLEPTYAAARKKFEATIHADYYVVPVKVCRLYQGVKPDIFMETSLINWHLPLCLLDYAWISAFYPELMDSLRGQVLPCPVDMHQSKVFRCARYASLCFDGRCWSSGRNGEVDATHHGTTVFTIPRN